MISLFFSDSVITLIGLVSHFFLLITCCQRSQKQLVNKYFSTAFLLLLPLSHSNPNSSGYGTDKNTSLFQVWGIVRSVFDEIKLTDAIFVYVHCRKFDLF